MLLYDNQPSGNCYKVRLLFGHLDLDRTVARSTCLTAPIGRRCWAD
jgi:hypothetical protein